MSEQNHKDMIAALLADETLGQLSPEDRAQLERSLGQDSNENEEMLGRLILTLDESAGDDSKLPESLRGTVEETGLSIVSGPGKAHSVTRRTGVMPWLLVAASVAIAGVVGLIAYDAVLQRDRSLVQTNTELAALKLQIEENQTTLAEARMAQASLETALAEASEESLRLAEKLASATSDLDAARLEIARYEEPVNPEELQQNRKRLLEIPDTIRVAWQPFDLPDAPAEQRTVQGDVVWNNDLQQGYLRFVGLAVNDPSLEQYQVWVIDERGMEQKVSGGVFNATADGELIVPIEPGIEVGRVAVFAVTVENPGGTWVPDLQRRVVVAPTG